MEELSNVTAGCCLYSVLKRVVAVVEFLRERGLSLRGGNEVFGSSQNRNFLRQLVFLAQFDDFLADHNRRFDNSSKGEPFYLLLHATNLCFL